MTIFRKSLLTLSAAAFGLSASLVIAVLVFMNSLYYETNAEGLANTAKALFAIAGEGRLETIFAANTEKNFPEGIFPPPGGSAFRLTLIDQSGNVRWDSQVAGELVNHLGRKEVEAALEGREGKARRNSISTGMRQIYFALPVRDSNGVILGVFRLSQTVPGFWMRISAAALPFLLFAGLLFLVAFGAILVFSHSLSESLVRLVDIAEDSSGGIPRAADGPGAALSGETLELFNLEKALRGMAKELKTRLEKAEAEGRRLEAILNGISEAVIAANSKLSLSLANPKARSLFGLNNIQNLSLLEATRSAELEQIAVKALAEGRLQETELRLCGAGAEQRFQVFAAPLSSAENAAPEGIVMVLEDITRLTRLEQVRRDFVANVSHELRTPIQLIKGFSETLLDNPLDDIEQIRHFIGIIHKNSNVMENLTNDLLTLAGLENSGAEPHGMEEQNIAPLFAEAVSPLEAKADKKQITIITDCSGELRARLNGPFIIQAIINLLDNGIKYSPEGSKIRASARREGNCLILEVRDQGIGIPPEHLERIFERFYRVDKGRNRGTGGAEGTGLGLSIVRHIALIHNGTAEVESRAGEGSVFRIRIPQGSEAQPQVQP